MALELKRRAKENLKNLRVFIEDTSDMSPEYFSIVEFPEFFGDGKSLIRLKGNRDRLQENTPIQVEVLDQAGKPMYYEFSTIKNSDDTIIISVWTYTGRGDRHDTAPGIGEVIIVGTARDVPDEFRDRPNVRWTRKVPIDIQQLAPSKIVFKSSVVPKGSVSASIQVVNNLPQSNGELREIDTSTNVKYKKSVWGTTTSLEWQSGNTFNSEMISGSIYLDVGNSTLFPRLTGQTQPTTFTASIKDVDSTTILRLTSPFTSSDGRSDGSVHTYEYSDGDALTANIRYFTSASTVTTQNQISFANITLTNVNPETGRIASVNTLIKSEGAGGDFEFVGNTKVNQDTTFTYRVAIPTEHLNDVKTLKVQFLNQQGQVSKTETIIKNVVFPGGNVYIGGNQSIVTGSLFIANAIGSGLEMGGHSSGFLKSVGYEGVTSASLGIGPGGFIIYSGSNGLQMGADVLQGVGMQFVGDNDDRHLIFTTANGGLLDVKTDKFFIGTSDSQFVSGSDGNIEISSSLFHLDPVNDRLVIGANAIIEADLSANNIRTPATIGGVQSTDLNASSSITSEGLARFVSASIGGWNVNTSSIFSSNLEINSAGRIQTKDYVSNLKGWIIDETGRAEFENVKIRGTLATTTFEKESVNAVGGQLFVANSTTITGSSVLASETTMSVANASGFSAGEVLQIKKISDTGFTTEYVLIESSSLDGDGSDPNSISGKIYVERGYTGGATPGNTFVGDTGSNAQDYEESQVIVSTGKVGTGYIRMNANPNDQSTPYIDIVERTGSGTYDVELKARLGDLSGLANTNKVFNRSNPGFGLATDNVFLQGGIIATFGEIGGFSIDSTTISSSNNNLILRDSGELTGSAILLGDKTTDNYVQYVDGTMTVRGDLAVDQLTTPATIGGSPSTLANASASITSDGFAKFVSASIGGFEVSETQINSSNDNLILKANGQITASDAKIDGNIIAELGRFDDVQVVGTIAKNSSNEYLLESWVTSSAYITSSYFYGGSKVDIGNVGQTISYGNYTWTVGSGSGMSSYPFIGTTISASKYTKALSVNDTQNTEPPTFKRWADIKGYDGISVQGLPYGYPEEYTTDATVENVVFRFPSVLSVGANYSYWIRSENITIPSSLLSTENINGLVLQTAVRIGQSYGGFQPTFRVEILDTSNNVLKRFEISSQNAGEWLPISVPFTDALIYLAGNQYNIRQTFRIKLEWYRYGAAGGSTSLDDIRIAELRILKAASTEGMFVKGLQFEQSALAPTKFGTAHFGNLIPGRDNVYDLGQGDNVGSGLKITRWDDVYATNGTIQTSDINQKENIVESDLGLTFVNSLRPVSYTWIGKTRTHYGLIAQEVSSSLSGVGKTTLDFAGLTTGSMMGLRYAELISPMIKAIQELSNEVNQLKLQLSQSQG